MILFYRIMVYFFHERSKLNYSASDELLLCSCCFLIFPAAEGNLSSQQEIRDEQVELNEVCAQLQSLITGTHTQLNDLPTAGSLSEKDQIRSQLAVRLNSVTKT